SWSVANLRCREPAPQARGARGSVCIRSHWTRAVNRLGSGAPVLYRRRNRNRREVLRQWLFRLRRTPPAPSPPHRRRPAASSCPEASKCLVDAGAISAERGLRTFLELVVDVQIHLVVVEAGQAGDLLALRGGCEVDPHQARILRAADADVPVVGRAPVRAAGRG